MARMKKKAASTSLRSDTQATDSTRSGWMANTAADKGGAPEGAGHLEDNQEQEDGGSRVKEDVGEMIAAGVKSVDLIIEHE